MSLKSLAKTINANAGVLQMFQIDDRWSAEEMRNFAPFGVVDGGARILHSEMLRDGLLFLES